MIGHRLFRGSILDCFHDGMPVISHSLPKGGYRFPHIKQGTGAKRNVHHTGAVARQPMSNFESPVDFNHISFWYDSLGSVLTRISRIFLALRYTIRGGPGGQIIVMNNHSNVYEFIFIPFPPICELEIVLFIMFLLIYIVIITGNLTIIILVYWDSKLYSPMYFFLGNISFLEMSISTVVIPKLLSTLLSNTKSISYAGCFMQCYFYFLLGTIDFFVLAAMSIDRYIAICNPLQYVTIMTWNKCFYLVLASWMVGIFFVTPAAVVKAMLPFCGINVINHFFCDSSLLIKLACIDTQLLEMIDFFMYSFVILGSFIVTIVSYTVIVITVLKIPSVTGRQKMFSTCASHLFLVCLGYGGTIFLYVIPKQKALISINKMVSMITVFVTPILSPFVFTLRNERVKIALVNLLFKESHQ
ncbi:olfactory receptor 6M1-like [Bombina bombina]|uniref:olfactory receptor 6M1-like n=1 Tax=Bombina bombina TaxID=8345 RepID=UPI00235AC59B|nr:olfactory receptor 6M1-like [Bombina bombina]